MSEWTYDDEGEYDDRTGFGKWYVYRDGARVARIIETYDGYMGGLLETGGDGYARYSPELTFHISALEWIKKELGE